jgi:hypothetical protein
MELLIELVKLATAIVVLVTALRRHHSEVGDGDKEKEEGR